MITELPYFITKLPDGDYELTLSPSSAMTFDLCEAKFSWSRLTGIELATSLAAPNYGKAMHAALAAWYQIPAPSDGQFDAASEALREHFTANPQPESNSKGFSEWRTELRAMQALAAYIAKWRLDPDWRILAVEDKFEKRIGSFSTGTEIVHVKVHGLRDLVVESYGQRWIVDHKTMQEWGDKAQDEGAVSWQFMCYVACDQPMGGAIGNYIVSRKPYSDPARKPKANDLPRDQFERQVYTYTPEALEEWRHDALETAQRVWDLTMNEGSFHRCRGACGHYGRCEYYKLCWETDPGLRLAAALGADYRPRTPSPFEDDTAGKDE
jgi:hypothetical protein